MFKLRPYLGLLLAALFILVTGSLLSAYFYIEEVESGMSHRWLFVAITTGIVSLLLVVVAYSRYGFRHLWHHRPGYKRG